MVRRGRVIKYEFKPSGRVVWTVKGREGDYQVIPETGFCSCEDYYFRVIGRKKDMCYHLIAQRIAEASRQHKKKLRTDAQYALLSSKIRLAR